MERKDPCDVVQRAPHESPRVLAPLLTELSDTTTAAEWHMPDLAASDSILAELFDVHIDDPFNQDTLHRWPDETTEAAASQLGIQRCGLFDLDMTVGLWADPMDEIAIYDAIAAAAMRAVVPTGLQPSEVKVEESFTSLLDTISFEWSDGVI